MSTTATTRTTTAAMQTLPPADAAGWWWPRAVARPLRRREMAPQGRQVADRPARAATVGDCGPPGGRRLEPAGNSRGWLPMATDGRGAATGKRFREQRHVLATSIADENDENEPPWRPEPEMNDKLEISDVKRKCFESSITSGESNSIRAGIVVGRSSHSPCEHEENYFRRPTTGSRIHGDERPTAVTSVTDDADDLTDVSVIESEASSRMRRQCTSASSAFDESFDTPLHSTLSYPLHSTLRDVSIEFDSEDTFNVVPLQSTGSRKNDTTLVTSGHDDDVISVDRRRKLSALVRKALFTGKLSELLADSDRKCIADESESVTSSSKKSSSRCTALSTNDFHFRRPIHDKPEPEIRVVTGNGIMKCFATDRCHRCVDHRRLTLPAEAAVLRRQPEVECPSSAHRFGDRKCFAARPPPAPRRTTHKPTMTSTPTSRDVTAAGKRRRSSLEVKRRLMQFRKIVYGGNRDSELKLLGCL